MFLALTILVVVSASPGHSQQFDDVRFTSDIIRLAPVGVLADTINVWGAVSQRGRFMVPRGTTVSQMLSYTGGPGVGGAAGSAGRTEQSVFAFYSRQQVEVYLNRFDEEQGKETVEVWTYRLRDPFPEGMRDFELKNGEYITVDVRRRPTTMQYVLFGVTTLGSLAGGFFLLERIW